VGKYLWPMIFVNGNGYVCCPFNKWCLHGPPTLNDCRRNHPKCIVWKSKLISKELGSCTWSDLSILIYQWKHTTTTQLLKCSQKVASTLWQQIPHCSQAKLVIPTQTPEVNEQRHGVSTTYNGRNCVEVLDTLQDERQQAVLQPTQHLATLR